MKLPLALLLATAALAQQHFSGGPYLDAAINKAVHDDLIPGAVLLVGHNGVVVYRKAYGSRVLIPRHETMTVNTIFDAASLTKVIATTSCIMKLFEQGKIRLSDPVTNYLPEFQGGHSGITVRDLLTHFSGMPPDLDLNPPWHGYQTGIEKALIEKPIGPPGVRFVYSDINFILLGEIVHRLSGKMLNEYAREILFQPLGMRETMFLPPASLRPRIAPTEIDPETGRPLRGVVHDPTSRYMGGIAGHAGLFTTADDMSRFAEMLLGRGQRKGVRIFSPLTVRKFTTPETPADQPILRGFGWDIDSPFSGNRGELYPLGSFGHTGFTGTSLWVDPRSKSYVILLTNSVHPHRGKNITTLRGKVATIVAAAFGIDTPGVELTGYEESLVGAGLRRVFARNVQVLTGLDVLVDQKFAPFQGKRIGLITNQTGLNRDGLRNIDLMRAAGVQITALFSPEHGFAGQEDHPNVSNSVDALTGIPIFSLFQKGGYRPTPEMLKNVDVLVYDIQDVGTRFYTYSCTLLYALEASAKAHLPFYVLDRPNPITGVHVEGPILDKNLESFVGCYEMPLRHGMTFGELAKMANSERHLDADLHIVATKNWERGDWFDSTGLLWVDPSPNMRTLNAAVLYPGLAMLEEGRNYSVGRGTDAPFEQIGADWIDGQKLAAALNCRFIPGVRVYPTRFRPASSNFAGKTIEGVRFVITDREALDSVRLGLEIIYALQNLYPGKLNLEGDRFLIGNREVIDALQHGKDPRTIQLKLEDSLRAFLQKRQPYLLY
ncbi:MAG TPA: exo-beta-N-acetylmuramidase NamZ domain-containing protein [Bryobacteraceae bacterium]|nr:exo-beta-N-acetylmuramidase NamZ domain-containing protein [Bryobacteraceae bacterium]